jgi:transposase InsO family protein
VELRSDPALSGLRLPGRSRLATLFKRRCPECVATRKRPLAAPKRLLAATAAHQVWQLDSQEGIRLSNGEIATICNIRDPVGAAMIASRAFAVQTKRHWRKLTWTEVQSVLREALTEWQTLPDEVRTDNELRLAGSPNDPFPSKLTLWLAGLNVRHRFIRPGCPTDQPQIERNHRTLDDFALDEEATTDRLHLQSALDRERKVYNYQFPSQASDCAGRPPIIAHPELLTPRRYYEPALELALFDIGRVYASAQVSLGRQLYSLGKKLVRERHLSTVLVRFDPYQKAWVFFSEDQEELVRRPPKGLDVQSLTGLDPSDCQLTLPVQLSLPFLFP